ncbi:MAG TPA: hypothetical protein VK112_12840 [Fodinibius sp.]|nr:hypothetical protein [Fodinibius sp.]
MSIACFILAGLTGVLYRLGFIGWLPGSLGLGNIRHAHSHLMFFGWAVPFPMYIIWTKIRTKERAQSLGSRRMKQGIIGGLLFGLLAYPFFLFYGYRPVEIGSVSLPLSVIISGLVMISWYVYIWGYLKMRQLLDDKEQPWFDGALLLLFICSLGAWSIALVQALAPDNQLLMTGLTHFFLASFTEGWVVLVLLGVLISAPNEREKNRKSISHIPLALICLGAPLTFPYGIAESLLTPFLLAVARLGGAMAGIGLIWMLFSFLKTTAWHSSCWRWPIILLAFKAVMQLIASVAPASLWLSDYGLRILYLHVLLLGALSITLMGWLNISSGSSKGYFNAVVLSIGITLVSLTLPTQVWPTAWRGGWIFYALAGAALLPVITVFVHWIAMIKPNIFRI